MDPSGIHWISAIASQTYSKINPVPSQLEPYIQLEPAGVRYKCNCLLTNGYAEDPWLWIGPHVLVDITLDL